MQEERRKKVRMEAQRGEGGKRHGKGGKGVVKRNILKRKGGSLDHFRD